MNGADRTGRALLTCSKYHIVEKNAIFSDGVSAYDNHKMVSEGKQAFDSIFYKQKTAAL